VVEIQDKIEDKHDDYKVDSQTIRSVLNAIIKYDKIIHMRDSRY